MSEPHYGYVTIARPKLPAGDPVPEGWVETACPYCGCDCYRVPDEPVPTPAGYAVACTDCSIRRSENRRVMDEERAKREAEAGVAPPPALPDYIRRAFVRCMTEKFPEPLTENLLRFAIVVFANGYGMAISDARAQEMAGPISAELAVIHHPKWVPEGSWRWWS